MTSRSRKPGMSRRRFLSMAGLGLGLTAVGFVPRSILGSPAVGVARAAGNRSGTLRIGWTSPTNLDPAKFSDAPDESIGSAIYNRLLTLDSKSKLVPSLAKSWTVSPDGKTVTLKLQSGVKFHDGSAFSADDVKFTIDRLRAADTKSAAASLFTSLASIEITDPTTITFKLSQPDAVFLNNLADYHVFILKKGTKDPAKELNGTGPFKTTPDKIDFTTRATFVANPDYWEADLPKVNALEMTFVKATADLVPSVQGGQIDWVARVPFARFVELKSDPNLATAIIAANQFSHIRLRSDRKPGSDPKVRQAFRLAMNRDEVNKAIFQGLATPGRDTPIGPLYGDLYSEATPVPKRDVAAAKQLLADAGYPNGLDIDFYVPQGEEGSDELAQVLQAQWKEAGINVKLQIVPQSVYYSDKPNNWLDADLAVTFWASRPDPQAYLDLAWRSKEGTDLGKWNEAHFSDPELDKLIDAARIETDTKKRAQDFAEIQRILIERGPSYIPYFQPLFVAQSKKVSGIDPAGDVGLTTFASATIQS